jgi:hypothetical protein
MASHAVTVLQLADTEFPGRSNITFHYAAALGIVAEAAAVLDIFAGAAYTPTTASSYTVPVNKRLRIESILINSGHTAANTFTFLIRLTTAVTGNVIDKMDNRLGAAGHMMQVRALPNGMEFPAATVLQFSRINSVGGAHDWIATGFLYDVQS